MHSHNPDVIAAAEAYTKGPYTLDGAIIIMRVMTDLAAVCNPDLAREMARNFGYISQLTHLGDPPEAYTLYGALANFMEMRARQIDEQLAKAAEKE